MASILFVDDDDVVRYALGKYLRRFGHDITESADGAEALKRIAEKPFDLVITDIIMPETEGIELIRELHEKLPDLPIIAISGGGRMAGKEYLSMAKTFGAKATLDKPLDPDELVRLVEAFTAS